MVDLSARQDALDERQLILTLGYEEEDRFTRRIQAGGRRVYVETSGRAQYEPTRRFYEACGYAREAVLTDFYAPGDDKVIYGQSLVKIGRNQPSAHP